MPDQTPQLAESAHTCCACFTHNNLPCCNPGHPTLTAVEDCWLCPHPVTDASNTCPAGDCLAHYPRPFDRSAS